MRPFSSSSLDSPALLLNALTLAFLACSATVEVLLRMRPPLLSQALTLCLLQTSDFPRRPRRWGPGTLTPPGLLAPLGLRFLIRLSLTTIALHELLFVPSTADGSLLRKVFP